MNRSAKMKAKAASFIQDNKPPAKDLDPIPFDAGKPKKSKVGYNLIFRATHSPVNLDTVEVPGMFKTVKKASKIGAAIAKASKGRLTFSGLEQSIKSA
jgi:hypothetical protein